METAQKSSESDEQKADNACKADKLANITFSIIQSDEEKAKIFEFMQHIFRVNEPITRALNCSEEDTYEFYKDICESGFKGPFSLIARDKNTGEMAGICLNAVYEDLDNYGNSKRDISSTHDYAEEIAAGPYSSMNANRLVAIIELTERKIRQFLPNSQKAFKIDILAVHPKFAGIGLGSKLTQEALKLANSVGCDAVFTCASAKASAHIFQKHGLRMVQSVAFDSFYENGRKVYENLHDGGTETALLVLELL